MDSEDRDALRKIYSHIISVLEYCDDCNNVE